MQQLVCHVDGPHSLAGRLPEPSLAVELYLDLLKRSLTNYLHGDQEVETLPVEELVRPELLPQLAQQTRLVRPKPFEPEQRECGADWPPTAETMVGLKRLDNLQHCLEQVLRDEVPGDVIETGVWRGGASIFMQAVLKAYGATERRVWLADSFAGLPPPRSEYPQDETSRLHEVPYLAVSQQEVRENFRRYRLLDENVRFLEGWFRDTLPAAPIERLAVARLDGDMYESTLDALSALYPKLSVGGFVIIDDFGALGSCQQAVHDFRRQHGIEDEMLSIDWTGVYWRRSV